MQDFYSHKNTYIHIIYNEENERKRKMFIIRHFTERPVLLYEPTPNIGSPVQIHPTKGG